MFEPFLVKREDATYIREPLWSSFYRSHNITLHDVVNFALIKKTEEGADEDEDGEGSKEDVQEENPLNRTSYVFTMKIHATNCDIKELPYISSMWFPIKCMYCLPSRNPFNVSCILQD
jgi:hypothetical protein